MHFATMNVTPTWVPMQRQTSLGMYSRYQQLLQVVRDKGGLSASRTRQPTPDASLPTAHSRIS